MKAQQETLLRRLAELEALNVTIEDISSSHPEFVDRLRGPMRAYVGVALRADDRTSALNLC